MTCFDSKKLQVSKWTRFNDLRRQRLAMLSNRKNMHRLQSGDACDPIFSPDC